jgi:exopolyphosphatase/guanosine-5'-triphosphate,3'-diphosphate pyrophosphatase
MRLAAVDIGTNSIHMIVVEVGPGHSFTIVDREKAMVRLGAGGLDGRALAPAAMSAAIETLVRFRQLADSRRVDEVIAAATSAVREAQNGGEFLRTVAERTGIRPRVIAGTEEARLVHMAAVYGVNAGSGMTVVVDLGGGSVEMTLGTQAEIRFAASFPLGVIRLAERFVTTDPLSSRDERRLVKHVRSVVGAFADRVRMAGFDRVIATSGTSLSLGEVALSGRKLFDSDTIHHSRISSRELHRVRKQMVALDMQRRLRLPGLDARRADLIVAGAVILDTIVQRLGAEEIILCDLGLREGLVLDYVARNHKKITRADRYPDIRRRSVIELGERCRWYVEHADQVAKLALSLFDQTRSMHEAGEHAREWLEYAALLHDIGGHIAYLGHHKHSYYLIRNGGLRGFEPEEIEAIALIARYHRRGRPKKSHSALASLQQPARRTVRLASAILRVAESLDRSHAQVIDRVELRPRGEHVELRLYAHGAAELERWSAQRQVRPLARLLGRDIRVEALDKSHAGDTDDTASVPGAPVGGGRDRRIGQDDAARAAGQVAGGRPPAGRRH